MDMSTGSGMMLLSTLGAVAWEDAAMEIVVGTRGSNGKDRSDMFP